MRISYFDVVEGAIKTKRALWLKRVEKSSILRSRELYFKEYIIDQLDDYDEISIEDVGFLSS